MLAMVFGFPDDLSRGDHSGPSPPGVPKQSANEKSFGLRDSQHKSPVL